MVDELLLLPGLEAHLLLLVPTRGVPATAAHQLSYSGDRNLG